MFIIIKLKNKNNNIIIYIKSFLNLNNLNENFVIFKVLIKKNLLSFKIELISFKK